MKTFSAVAAALTLLAMPCVLAFQCQTFFDKDCQYQTGDPFTFVADGEDYRPQNTAAQLAQGVKVQLTGQEDKMTLVLECHSN
jgi:hypothetical protein